MPVDEDGYEMHGTEIARISNAREWTSAARRADESFEYSIRAAPDADSGLMVYGCGEMGWRCNPPLRALVRILLEEKLGIKIEVNDP